MKKFTAILLAVILIFSCLCLSGCSFIGEFFNVIFGDDGDNSGDSGHEHQFESYFIYTQCSVDGCRVVGRIQSENVYADDFVYTLTDARIDEISALYGEILTYLADGDNFGYFEQLYEQYLNLFDYAAHQYQVSSILSDVEYNTDTVNNYRAATKLYNEMRANYYAMFGLVYNSNYRDEFYEGWDVAEIEEALHYAEIYGDSADNNNAVDDILAEYDAYMDEIGNSISSRDLNYIGELYGRLVEANNNVAKAAYYNNYMDYAYAHEYNRSYTPGQVGETMRKFVKTYIAPIFITLAYKNDEYYSAEFNTAADRDFYYGLTSDSLFTATSEKHFGRVKSTIDLISEYFSYINRPSSLTNGEAVDFRSELEELFKNGNYFTGDYRGAYTWWISKIQKPILYLGTNYDSAFTFVHEFGHYYNNIYNGSMGLSYDHDETHSQGNEMLFLAWLSQHKPTGVTNGFDMVEVEQLYDMLINIIIATAVDEFEQAAYTGLYNGQPITCSYADLFTQILGSYRGTYKGVERSALEFLNSKYWAYVAFNSAAYYISYAMSALPSIELYVKAKSSGMYGARSSYVKLFTFSNDSRFATTDSSGKKYLRANATYEAILNYCGLSGPFQEELYTTLKAYFDTRPDLK